MHVLVVGGEGSYVKGPFTDSLRAVGVEVAGHWDWTVPTPKDTFPDPCEGVIILREMTASSVASETERKARSAGLPVARVPRQFSDALPMLQQSGIVQKQEASVKTSQATSNDEVLAAMREYLTAERARNNSPSKQQIRAAVKSALGPKVETSDALIDRVRSEVYKASPEKVREWAELVLDERPNASDAEVWVRVQELMEDSNFIDPRIALQEITRARAKGLGALVLDKNQENTKDEPRWFQKRVISRDRLGEGVRAGIDVFKTLDPEVTLRLKDWLVSGAEGPLPEIEPVTRKFKGKPIEILTVMLLSLPINAAPAKSLFNRAYRIATGKGLGPYYPEAVARALGRQMVDDPADAHYPDPLSEAQLITDAQTRTTETDAKGRPFEVVLEPAKVKMVEETESTSSERIKERLAALEVRVRGAASLEDLQQLLQHITAVSEQLSSFRDQLTKVPTNLMPLNEAIADIEKQVRLSVSALQDRAKGLEHLIGHTKKDLGKQIKDATSNARQASREHVDGVRTMLLNVVKETAAETRAEVMAEMKRMLIHEQGTGIEQVKDDFNKLLQELEARFETGFQERKALERKLENLERARESDRKMLLSLVAQVEALTERPTPEAPVAPDGSVSPMLETLVEQGCRVIIEKA